MRQTHFFSRLPQLSMLGFATALFTAANAQAQVVYSFGAQEVYDDNIYLENDEGSTAAGGTTLPEALDGNPNDDFITNVFVGASGALPETRFTEGAAELNVGALMFGSNDQETRLTVDSLFNIQSSENFIPKPYYIDLSSSIHSGANSIGTAEGTATRQSQVHDASIGFGVESFEFNPRTTGSLGYFFSRHDFLGEFTLNDSEGERDAIEEEGSDYFQNGVRGSLTRQMNSRFSTSLFSSLTDQAYTNVESRAAGVEDSRDPDVMFYDVGVGTSYMVSERLVLGAQVGLDGSHLKESGSDPVTILNPDGTESVRASGSNTDETSFMYAANATYFPAVGSALDLRIDQRQGTDLDGRRILVRSYALNGYQQLSDTLNATVAGRYLNSEATSGLVEKFDRYEVTAALSYSFTETLALSLGWNYAVQDQKSGDITRFVGGDDYTSNRVFLSVSTGLIGLRS